MPVQFFDREAEYRVVERRLPHWSQAGVVCFLTWRTADSMPRSVLAAWIAERNDWLRAQPIDPDDAHWRSQPASLPQSQQNRFHETIVNRWQEHFDECHGACVLRQANLAEIVANSLRHFDGQRYEMCDFVVMPNHVHALVAFPDDESMLLQCKSWKRFTATQINRRLGRRGEFWQNDGFDHLVRSAEQFEHLRRYIADNPRRAGLNAEEYVCYRNPAIS